MIVLDRPAVIACYEFSQEIEDCIGRACFTQSGTYIGFTATIFLSENGKSMNFQDVRFAPYDGFAFSQAEVFYEALLALRCFMALENHLVESRNDQLKELGKKLSSTHIDHCPWHFWDILEAKDLNYLIKQFKLQAISSSTSA